VAGLGTIALNSAPVLGGLMLAVAAGQFRGPDYRGLIKQDMDLLDRLPPEATGRRAEPQSGADLPGQLAGHGALALCCAVHHHLVGRQPQPQQLAADVHLADPAVGGDRGLRIPWGGARNRFVRAQTARWTEVIRST